MSALAPQADQAVVRALDARFRQPLISFFVRRVHDRAEAEDLTQQVFLRLLGSQAVGRLEHAERFVFTVAANLLRDRAKSAARRYEARAPMVDPQLLAEISREAQEERSPERVLLGRETLADVFRTLDELGEKTKAIFVLHRLENMKHREIAELFGIGASTVEKHVIKATLHLARRYGPAS
jgi:RNA polymerase sigma-70 factor (ECF subfamily)